MNKEKVLEFAEGSLDRVLAFYDRQGISLPHRPKFRYAKVNPVGIMREPFMSVLPDEEAGKAVKTSWHRNFSRARFEILGITLSDEALEENLQIEISLNYLYLHKYWRENFSGADILLFPPLGKYLTDGYQKNLDGHMAHEVWHLIEKDRNVLHTTPLIAEGTARRAEGLFFGKDLAVAKNPNLYITIFYYGADCVVRDCMRAFRNPYKEMLNPQVRERAQRELLKRYEEKISEFFRRSCFEKDHVRSDPTNDAKSPFQERLLSNGLTPAGVAKTYRDAGAPTLARELEGQDLGPYIKSLKLLHECAAEPA